MYKLALSWLEDGRNRSQTFSFDEKAADPIRIGRDASQCDVVLKDTTKTVSGLHVEIFFNYQHHTFYLRNLTKNRDRPNPAWVDGQKIIQQEMPLRSGTNIQLGKVSLKANIESPGIESNPVRGLKCHVCGHISPQDRLSLVCPWCGTSLASADSAMFFPDELT